MILLSLLPALAGPLSASVRTTVGAAPTAGAAGLELRTTGTLFVRARAGLHRGADNRLFQLFEDRAAEHLAELPTRVNWLARSGSLELGWAPTPQLRVAAVVSSHLRFTKRGRLIMNSYTPILPTTLGATYLGSEVGVGHTVGALSFVAQVRGLRAVHGRNHPQNSSPSAGRHFHGMQWTAGLESRYTWRSMAIDLEIGAGHTRPSPVLREFTPPGGAPGRTYPTAALAVGWTGAAPWKKR
jgi:hypothetical protein